MFLLLIFAGLRNRNGGVPYWCLERWCISAGDSIANVKSFVFHYCWSASWISVINLFLFFEQILKRRMSWSNIRHLEAVGASLENRIFNYVHYDSRMLRLKISVERALSYPWVTCFLFYFFNPTINCWIHPCLKTEIKNLASNKL